MSNLTPGIQMRDRLLLEWKPHTPPQYPGDEDSVRYAFWRLYDEAYDLLVGDGQEHEEAVSGVRVIFGTSLPEEDTPK